MKLFSFLKRKNALSDRHWNELGFKWEIQRKKLFFPLVDAPQKEIAAWDFDSFKDKVNSKDLIELLKAQGDDVVVCLPKEWGNVEYTEVSKFQLPIDNCGSEMVFTNEMCDWFIYTSHENVITVGGDTLLTFIKEIWQDWDDEKYSW